MTGFPAYSARNSSVRIERTKLLFMGSTPFVVRSESRCRNPREKIIFSEAEMQMRFLLPDIGGFLAALIGADFETIRHGKDHPAECGKLGNISARFW